MNEEIVIISWDMRRMFNLHLMIIHSNQDTRSFGTPLLICQVISINATVLHDNGQTVLI